MGVYGERMGRGIDPAERARILADAEKRAREHRWNVPGRSRVSHPAHGTVVVPHSSNLAAIMNAAEVWRVEEWLANYPRRILDWKTPQMLYDEYMTVAA